MTSASASSIPRPEYPRPQFVRDDWLCLNGEWEFEIDQGDSGEERGLRDRPLAGRITVPFCPESALSGVGRTDFLRAVWYRRTVEIPAAWAGREVLLHFQAVDYDATVWINGQEAARHRGGFTPFSCVLSRFAAPGETAEIVVRARDFEKDPKPRGKQAMSHGNEVCVYTRTTGIWQTVWLEPAPEARLLRPRITPEVAASRFVVEQRVSTQREGHVVRIRLLDAQGEVASAEAAADETFACRLELPIPPERARLWEPGVPHLYDLEITLLDADGRVVDSARSYAGLRSVGIRGKRVLLNGRPVFQRLVLDQGYYPDGLMTAPDDAALARDIKLGFRAGFNGARLHQKIFEERFLYHADRLGYLVWGEFADWGCGSWTSDVGKETDCQHVSATYITQWIEALERDYSHPAIIGWCPLNETRQVRDGTIQNLDDVTRGLFLATKLSDPTRPVIDASGYSHRVAETDVYDGHDYEQDPEKFAARYAPLAEGGAPPPYLLNGKPTCVPYAGQPYFVSEFGGIWWNPRSKPGDDSWGYGDRPRSVEEFYERFEGLCGALLDHPAMFGYCYTQLTDVFQEQNGIYGFDRSRKFDLDRLAHAQRKPAAMERDFDNAIREPVAQAFLSVLRRE